MTRDLDKDRLHMSAQAERPYAGRGETPRGVRRGESESATPGNSSSGLWTDLMERVCEPANLKAALKRVKSNGGSPGVDGMSVAELKDHLVFHWPLYREELLSGSYEPKPVRRVSLKKDGGGVRVRGIPTVLDRSV